MTIAKLIVDRYGKRASVVAALRLLYCVLRSRLNQSPTFKAPHLPSLRAATAVQVQALMRIHGLRLSDRVVLPIGARAVPVRSATLIGQWGRNC